MAEDLYEIVQTDPLHRLKLKGSELEKEIDAIKEILRDTVTASKISKSSDEIVERIIDMIKVSQEMVETVSSSNIEMGRQLNQSIKEMAEGNRRLSEKLDGLIEFFAQAAESEEEKGPSAFVKKMEQMLQGLEGKLDSMDQRHKNLEGRLTSLESKPAPAPLPMQAPRPFARPVSLVPAPPKPLGGEGSK